MWHKIDRTSILCAGWGWFNSTLWWIFLLALMIPSKRRELRMENEYKRIRVKGGVHASSRAGILWFGCILFIVEMKGKDFAHDCEEREGRERADCKILPSGGHMSLCMCIFGDQESAYRNYWRSRRNWRKELSHFPQVYETSTVEAAAVKPRREIATW